MKSVMVKNYAKTPSANIRRSKFDRSHGHKTTFNAGYLIPVYLDEALPGDTHIMDATCFARIISPLNVPVMDNMYIDIHFFAVPLRIVWDNFKKFMGEQVDAGDSTSYTVPIFTPVTSGAAMDIFDYFGINADKRSSAGIDNISSLPIRCYRAIYNEWYRAKNVTDSISVPTGDGPDTFTSYDDLLKRSKRHDYFTSCLPWPQRGTAIDLPLGTSAPIDYVSGSDNHIRAAATGALVAATDTFSTLAANSHFLDSAAANSWNLDNSDSLQADLSGATSATINELREAFAKQRMLEKDARGGPMYYDMIQMHFGVTNPDYTMQRPHFLGGGTIRIQSQTHAATNATSGTDYQGNLVATATGLGNAKFTASFTEHCYILGIASARADLNYFQGIDRMWLRSTRYDFYWPDLALIGEQEVYNQEIYDQDVSSPGNNQGTFGYQERYAEYKYHRSMVTGQLNADYSTNLAEYHLAQDFATPPTLGQTFMEETPPMDRIKAAGSNAPDFIGDFYFNLQSVRPLPVHSVPAMTGYL